MREKVVLSWSGGKDSAMALHELRQITGGHNSASVDSAKR